MSSNPDFLVLDRSLPSRNFLTWRLSRDAGPSLQRKADIPSKVCAEKKNAYDYLHTRVSVLHNNLTQCGDALYTFTELDADTVSLHKIALGSESFTLVAGEWLYGVTYPVSATDQRSHHLVLLCAQYRRSYILNIFVS